MRFSEAWLREWVNPDVTTQQLADQLTMAGLEVDSVEPAAPPFSGVLVGHVLEVSPHPDADKLRVCAVDVGQDEPLGIVCGAANVAVGMRVPVATLGAVLPGDFRIKPAKLRGVSSSGMICSAKELGLAEASDGIMPLPSDAPIGTDFRDFFALEDSCIEVDLTPNRGDCLSLAGMAREVAVINRMEVSVPPMESVGAEIADRFAVSLEAPDACPRYVCRVVRGIDPMAETPLWMVERLRRSGIRSLSPVVDVTNYVLIELGQPMHGFDLARVEGRICVRLAREGERLQLLNGEELELRDDTLVIADAVQPLALAGIMGGEASGVTEQTVDVLLESAFFAPAAISGKSRSYGLHTDSSHRFERGVDPGLQVRAMERATALLIAIAGGRAGPLTEAHAESFSLHSEAILLRRDRVTRVLGIRIPDEEIEGILRRLDMGLESTDGGWRVRPPSSRFDVTREEDLIEEVGRIFGYDNIPDTPGSSGIALQAPNEASFDLERSKRLLVARGYHEVISYSFIAPQMAAVLAPGAEPVRLANPISSDMSVMRPTLWSGLVTTANYNRARQQERIRIFESGLRFVSDTIDLKQENVLSGLIQGSLLPEQWGAETRSVDFHDLKGDVETLLAQTGALEEFRFVAAEHPALHPGQSARVERGDRVVGWVGLIHPSLEKSLDLGTKTYVFELSVDVLSDGQVPAFKPISRFPAIRRDLALVVDRQLSFDDVKHCVIRSAPSMVRDIRLFDVYTGANIESNRKSLALSLILQDSSKTLTDEEVTSATEAIVEALKRELDAKLRD